MKPSERLAELLREESETPWPIMGEPEVTTRLLYRAIRKYLDELAPAETPLVKRLRDLASGLDALPSCDREAALAFLKERYADRGERR